MKKILMLALAVVLVLPIATAQAADVPNFLQVTGNYVTQIDGQNLSKQGYRTYSYICSVDLRDNFAKQYVSLLLNNYDFKLIDHEFDDFIKTSAKTFEWWYFTYTGSKNVTAAHEVIGPAHWNVYVVEVKNYESGMKNFSIAVSYGLTYGG